MFWLLLGYLSCEYSLSVNDDEIKFGILFYFVSFSSFNVDCFVCCGVT